MFIVPGKKESWQRNRAIELVSVHVIVPAIKPGTPPGNMKFALLGSDDQGPNDLPTRLVVVRPSHCRESSPTTNLKQTETLF